MYVLVNIAITFSQIRSGISTVWIITDSRNRIRHICRASFCCLTRMYVCMYAGIRYRTQPCTPDAPSSLQVVVFRFRIVLSRHCRCFSFTALRFLAMLYRRPPMGVERPFYSFIYSYWTGKENAYKLFSGCRSRSLSRLQRSIRLQLRKVDQIISFRQEKTAKQEVVSFVHYRACVAAVDPHSCWPCTLYMWAFEPMCVSKKMRLLT